MRLLLNEKGGQEALKEFGNARQFADGGDKKKEWGSTSRAETAARTGKLGDNSVVDSRIEVKKRQTHLNLERLSELAIQKVTVVRKKTEDVSVPAGESHITRIPSFQKDESNVKEKYKKAVRGKSLGFGFMDMKTHGTAKALLRFLNNSTCFGDLRYLKLFWCISRYIVHPA